MACNLVIFSHIAKSCVALITSIFLFACNLMASMILFFRCLQSCCSSNIAKYMVASIIEISAVCLQAYRIFKNCRIFRWLQSFKYLHVACDLVEFSNIARYLAASIIEFSPSPAILLYFQTLKMFGGFHH